MQQTKRSYLSVTKKSILCINYYYRKFHSNYIFFKKKQQKLGIRPKTGVVFVFCLFVVLLLKKI